MHKILIFLTVLLLPACAAHNPASSFSPFGYEALPVARVIAERLSEEYPPTRTTLFFDIQENGNPGFYMMLEEVCMHSGFTVVREHQAGAVTVRYVVDFINGSQPQQAYVLLETPKSRLTRVFSASTFELSEISTEFSKGFSNE